MTVNATCWCGAEISVDDASEVASAAIVEAFYTAHPHGNEPWSKYGVSSGVVTPLQVHR